jgi:hypothetical protein
MNEARNSKTIKKIQHHLSFTSIETFAKPSPFNLSTTKANLLRGTSSSARMTAGFSLLNRYK